MNQIKNINNNQNKIKLLFIIQNNKQLIYQINYYNKKI